jgi:hypothetical protein
MVGQSEPPTPIDKNEEDIAQATEAETRQTGKDSLHHETGVMTPRTQKRKLGMVLLLEDIT